VAFYEISLDVPQCPKDSARISWETSIDAAITQYFQRRRCQRISDPEVLLSAMIAIWIFGVEFFDGNGLQMASGIPMIYFPQ
jgi:hypothetical protein